LIVCKLLLILRLQRITAFERQSRPADDAKACQKYSSELASISMACKVPITEAPIKRWLKLQKSWDPMPASSRKYGSMLLPDLTLKDSENKNNLTRIDKYILGPCDFNGQGTSKKIPIKKSRALTDELNKGQRCLKISNLGITISLPGADLPIILCRYSVGWERIGGGMLLQWSC
jgi:hypothetical protein